MTAPAFNLLQRQDFMAPLRLLSREALRRQREILDPAALVLERALKQMLSQPGTGKQYYIRRSKRTGRRYWSRRSPGTPHQASAPGHPPAVDTGQLRASIGHGALPNGKQRVGTPLKKAPALNYGAIITLPSGHRVYLQPRPFMEPALAAAKEAMGAVTVSQLRRGPGRA